MNDIEKIRYRKPIKLFKFAYHTTEENMTIAEHIMEDLYLSRDNQYYKLVSKDKWKEISRKSVNRSDWFAMHSCTFVEKLCTAYEETKDVKYIGKAMHEVLNWKEIYLYDIHDDFAWHDHATAILLIMICKLFEGWKIENWNTAILGEILQIVKEHCTKLKDPNFYMEKHNHGLDQDIALFVASKVFDFIQEVREVREIALMRIQKQIDFLFEHDGTYSEHAPHYAVLFCNRLLDFISMGESDNEDIMNILELSLKYLKSICHYNGYLPNISDSEEIIFERYIKGRVLKCSEQDQIKLNNILKSTPKSAIYPQGGYGVINYPEEDIQLLFYSSFHSRVHKHHDDLSIILYAHGQPLLIDAGKYNYNYSDKERRYVISTLGHNTLRVDGIDTNLARLNVEKSGITHYLFDEEINILRGCHCLYDHINCYRTIINLDKSLFIILDEVKGYKEHEVEQIFNLAPNLECKIQGDSVTVMKDKEKVLLIQEFIKNTPKEINLYKGNTEPMHGWYSPTYNKIEKTNQIVFKKTGKVVKFATFIDVKNNDIDLEILQWEQDIDFIYKQDKYRVVEEGNRIYCYKNNKTIALNHILKPTLEQEIKKNNATSVFGDNQIIIQNHMLQKIGQEITWICTGDIQEYECAWYIYKDNQIYEKVRYQKDNKLIWVPKEEGTYHVKCFIKNKQENKKVIKSESVYIDY